MVFIYVLVECCSEGDVGFDASDPLVDATFNLSITFLSIQINHKG